MAIPEIVSGLVARFDRNREAYRSIHYNETQLRREFLDPFFEALGWDVTNKQGDPEAYKDVIHEDAIKVGGHTKAPDYCFRIGGTRKFFVEAKKPAVDIKDGIDPAYQLRRYAWSAKLPLSILADFEEFTVYDCRTKPAPTDKASTARTIYVTYTEYPRCWDKIASIFSREAVLKGSFDKYVESTKTKRGADEVDDAFLKDIESWRDLLARHLALRNPDLTQRELNFSVQQIIDRLIFLRICEDRGIEEYGSLMAQSSGGEVYERLCQLFQRADKRYNSGLFHFRQEKGRAEPPDELTLKLSVDDKPLKDIIKNLYYPDSPYEFSVLPADILGQVYEQFLGKVIRLTAGHRAVVEDKPEVKKAGGVYYTPTYIVDYIVKNTVGELLKDKTPKQVAKLRILDPACGSGSFLIGAYQYLLDWHRDWYVKNGPKKWATGRFYTLYQGRGGDWRLTPAERKRILLSNIYGVDIDSQAVEVTKLSLLLKVLEGENEQTLTRQLVMLHERALPDLANNIKYGNSLIGPDFYDNQQMRFPDDEERVRVNAFNWRTEFTAIMKAGGFDAVIGNPPWTFTKYVDWGDETKNYIQQKYLSTRSKDGQSRAKQAGKINLFAIFALKAINVLRRAGLMGIILPNNILRTTVYDVVRKQILEISTIRKIVDLKAGVFQGVTASTVIIILEADLPVASHSIEIVDNQTLGIVEDKVANKLNQADCLKNPSYVIDIFSDTSLKRIVSKADAVSTKLGEIVDVLNGIATEKNMAGILDSRKNNDSKPLLFGKDIARYHFEHSGKYVNYVRAQLLRARNESIFLAPQKLIMQRIGGILVTAYDDQQYYTFNSVNNLLLKSDSQYSLKYLLGILNSKLLRVYYIARFTNKSSLTVNVSKTFLDQLPIRTVSFSDFSNKARHDKMVQLVESMLALHKHKAAAKTQADQELCQRQIEATDGRIDQLVYELYGLTEKEIKIVEEETKLR